MAEILFALGRPGSGKSTATCYLMKQALGLRLETTRLKDYDILYSQFQDECRAQNFQRFRVADVEYGGFDVVDFSVLDEALEELQRDAQEKSDSHKYGLIVIEFARDNYRVALQHFDKSFLKKSHFLLIDAHLELCIQRIQERINNPNRLDNHFVSEDILRGYYSQNDISSLTNWLHDSCGVPQEHIRLIQNNDSQAQFFTQVEQFFRLLALQKVPAHS